MFNVYCNNINSNNTYCYPVGENWSALSMNVCHLGECTTPLMSREFPTLPWWDSLGSRALFPLDELTIPDSCVPSSLTAQMSAFISSVPQVLSLGPWIGQVGKHQKHEEPMLWEDKGHRNSSTQLSGPTLLPRVGAASCSVSLPFSVLWVWLGFFLLPYFVFDWQAWFYSLSSDETHSVLSISVFFAKPQS